MRDSLFWKAVSLIRDSWWAGILLRLVGEDSLNGKPSLFAKLGDKESSLRALLCGEGLGLFCPGESAVEEVCFEKLAFVKLSTMFCVSLRGPFLACSDFCSKWKLEPVTWISFLTAQVA